MHVLMTYNIITLCRHTNHNQIQLLNECVHAMNDRICQDLLNRNAEELQVFFPHQKIQV